MTEDRWEWIKHAACRGVDNTTMFPERGDMAGWREARRVCAGCTVRQVCLEEHMDEVYGCFGGLSPLERQRLRGARLRARRTA